mmetsp:Transcript_8512/g.10464  ORF Transcript_8512/g.10464 Transcript_8512/m.10464 type:complete len:141 (+) Transcript_8512:83-505(+)
MHPRLCQDRLSSHKQEFDIQYRIPQRVSCFFVFLFIHSAFSPLSSLSIEIVNDSEVEQCHESDHSCIIWHKPHPSDEVTHALNFEGKMALSLNTLLPVSQACWSSGDETPFPSNIWRMVLKGGRTYIGLRDDRRGNKVRR